VRRILTVLALVAPAGCAILPAYPPPSVVVGPPVVRVYPAPPPRVVYWPYYGRRYYW
jgi:hypothetical protein